MTRKLALAVAAVVAIAAFAVARLGRRADHPPASAGGRLGVEELMRHPERHPGSVEVEGVVSVVSDEERLITLIDTAEYEECGVTNCAALALPVRWDGPMPPVESRVCIEGRVRESSGKLFVEAVNLAPVASAPDRPR